MTDRPDWLPEKFENPEALAAAYKELEAKQSAPKPPETPATPAPQEPPAPAAIPPADNTPTLLTNDSLQPFVEEFGRDGKLSDDSYNQLGAMGVGRDMVDAYIEGQQAKTNREADATAAAVHGAVGGKESWDTMAAWAGSNLAAEQVDALNKMIEQGGQQALIAAQNLQNAYVQKEGKAPQLVKGNPSPAPTGAFRSREELREAMRDPKFLKDPVYAKQVQDRLAASGPLE